MSLASRNFTITEITHRELPQDMFYHNAAAFQMGAMQMIRNLIKKRFQKDIPITITSGYRSQEVNNNTPGSAKKSNHIWGLDDGFRLKTANDFVVDGSQVDPYEVYCYLKDVLGGEIELIYYEKTKHFHISPSQAKEAFIQR